MSASRMAGGVATGAAALLGMTACGGGGHGRSAFEGTTVSVAPTMAPSGGPPAHTAVPSLLIDQPLPFTPDEVHRLHELDKVTQLALIGYGPVWIYDRQIPTATVNPATYKPFTPVQTRDSAPVWNAVTDGKALVSHDAGVRDHLPIDATVPAGWASVRIAGLATTVPGVDMVVSSKTGERLGVPFGNGLVVAVSGDPQRATAGIRKIVGAKPTIRRIVSSGGMPGSSGVSGPILPVITPSASPAAAPPAPPPPVTPGAMPGAGPGPVPGVVPRTPPAPASVPAPSPMAPRRPGRRG